jgi:hypothetical protein
VRGLMHLPLLGVLDVNRIAPKVKVSEWHYAPWFTGVEKWALKPRDYSVAGLE